MKLLLTSGGVTNPSINTALVSLLGKPIAESTALFIPTAQYGHPGCSPQSVWLSIADGRPGRTGPTGLGWKSIGVLELTALPSVGADRWQSWVQDADVLLADGGDATYLCHWLRESGLADLLPTLADTVWVGVSAGSMVLTPRIGQEFIAWPQSPGDETLGVVDFSIFPHVDHPGFTENTMACAREWAKEIPGPAYAIDDDTAISVVDGAVEVISGGHWELLNPAMTKP